MFTKGVIFYNVMSPKDGIILKWVHIYRSVSGVRLDLLKMLTHARAVACTCVPWGSHFDVVVLLCRLYGQHYIVTNQPPKGLLY